MELPVDTLHIVEPQKDSEKEEYKLFKNSEKICSKNKRKFF